MESFSEEEYFYKVENMVLSSAHILRKLFAERWKQKTNKDWEHTKEQGTIFMKTAEGKLVHKKAFPAQQKLIEEACLVEMDVSLLAAMLRSFGDQVYIGENETVIKLTKLRNNQHHHPSGKLSEKDYNEKVLEFRNILVELRVDSLEIEKIIEKAGITSSVDALEAATELLKQAYQHIEATEFNEATACYNEATTMPSLLPSHKAVVHEKRAECYLKQAELRKKGIDSKNFVAQAMPDAFLALELNDSSWNAHYLIAKCHRWNECYDPAITHYRRVHALSPLHPKAKDELNLCYELSRKRLRYNVDPHSSQFTHANLMAGSEVMTAKKWTEHKFFRAASQGGGKCTSHKYIIILVELEEFMKNETTSSLPLSSWKAWLKPNSSRKAVVICTGHNENLKLKGLTDGAVEEMEALKELENDTTNSMQSIVVRSSDTANFIGRLGSRSRQVVVITEETKADIQKEIQNIPDLEADEIRWSDLTPQFAQEIEERITLFQNTPFQLKTLLKLLGNDDDNLVTKLNGKFLTSLILDQSPSLFKNSIPPLFPYYIPRQILSQARISNEIFKKKLADIFLFSGIKVAELSPLVGFSQTEKGRRTDTCTNQIKQRNVRLRFIVLLLKDHFEEICKLTSAPVHWLQYENGGFTWVKSRGNMDSLYKLVDEDEKQSRLSEKEFVDYLYSKKPIHRSKMPVCIADTPGMGKSCLLASIGRALISRDPRKLAIFANLTELVAHVKREVLANSDLEQVLINVLSNFLNNHDNELAIFLFKDRLKNGTLNIELLLDGYDEVNTQEFQLANECLRCLIENFVSVRIIVSTRPHLLLSLENILQTVGFKIEPFSNQDQIEFLVKFWKAQQRPDKNLDSEKLARFGTHCLKIMVKKISANDRNIAGIPLLCLLIAETYQKNAVNYADPDNIVDVADLAPVEADITCITDLFKHVIEVKFELYYSRHQLNSSSRDKVELMNAHIVESLRLLFPNNCNIPRTHDAYPTETLLQVGFLEKGSTEQTPRFIHRSFAEYFVSFLAVNNFREKNEEDCVGVGEVTNFVFSVLLSTTGVELPSYRTWEDDDDDLFAITYSSQLAAYFINDQVHSLPAANYKDVSQQVGSSDIAVACAHDDHVQLFRYLLKSKFFELEKPTLLSINFLMVTVLKSSAAMLDFLMEEFDQFENMLSRIPFLLLKAAAQRGVYSVFEQLCSSQRFRKVIEQNHEEKENLLEVAIEDTWEPTSQVEGKIEQRIRIVRLLLQINPLLIDLAEFDELNVHICILLELIKPKYGAEFLLAKKSTESSVLQDVAAYLTDEQFNVFVQSIPKAILQQMLKADDENEQKPLRLRLTNCWQRVPTLSLLSNLLDPDVLESDFTFERSSGWLRTLINFWGSWYDEGQGRMYSALHHAARERNRKLVELFLSFGMDVNAPDKYGSTPIFYAVEFEWDRDTTAQFQVLEELIKNGAELTKLNGSQQTVLHVAAQGREPDTMKFLLENGLAAVLNAQDSDGNTALHAAVHWARDHDIISLLVEWGADVNATNHSIHTPFMVLLKEGCCSATRLATMALLISKGAVMSKQTAARALEVVVCENNGLSQEEYEQLANKCLEKGGVLEKKDEAGKSLLHHAAYSQCLRGVQFLLSRGLKLNLRDNDGNTPLHLAISNSLFQNEEERFQLAKALVDADSSIVNVCNRDGETAISATKTAFLDSKLLELLQCSPETATKFMELIIKRNHGGTKFDKELANTLIKCGAELNWKTESGTTWLHNAVSSRHPDAIKFFVDQGIHPDVRDDLGNTPTHHFLASLNKDFNWIYVVNRLSFLVQLGANVKAVNNKGESLLHLAARKGSLPAVEYLLSMGCDVNAINTKGDSVVDLAIKVFRECATESDVNNNLKFVDVIKLMIDHELDLSRKNRNGVLFLHLISSFLVSSQFHQIVEHVVSKGKEQSFLLLDESNQNFVQAAQKHFTVLDETVSLVKCYGYTRLKAVVPSVNY